MDRYYLDISATVPLPSSETEAWWDTPGQFTFCLMYDKQINKPSWPPDHPNGVVPASADIGLSVAE